MILNIIPAYQVAFENILSKVSLDRDFSSVRERLNILINTYNCLFKIQLELEDH